MALPSLSLREQLFPVQSIGQLAIGAAALFMVFFFLAAGPLLFKETWATWQFVFIMYAFFILGGLVLAKEAFQISALRWVVIFIPVTIAAYFLFSLMLPKYSVGFPVGNLFALLAFSWTVAYAEESAFRAALLEFGRRRVGLGVVVSALAFSIFHVAAYAGLGIVPFGVAFVMGMALGFIYLATRSFAGTAVVVALHLSWNLSLLLG